MLKRILKMVGSLALGVVLVLAGGLAYLWAAYPRVGKLPEVTLPKSPGRIARGRYLATHVAMCIDCHSKHDWTRFDGPLMPHTLGEGGEKFQGGFGLLYAPNITPAHIGSWSDQQLYKSVVSGVTPDGTSLFPIMPYHHFGRASLRDVEDILAYIRTLPARSHQPPPSHLNPPLNVLVRTMPGPPHQQPRPSPSDSVAYGAYLVNLASCADCHTPQRRGRPIAAMTLAGGFTFHLPTGTVRSQNITPDRTTGIGSWTRAQFIHQFKTLDERRDESGPVKPGGFNTVMPWRLYAGMTDRDLGAIYDYLRTVKPVVHRVKIFSPGR